MVQPFDQQKDCLALNSEISANTYQISVLATEQQNKRTQNVVAGVAGAILFWPALFAMDFQDAAGTESNAIQSRRATSRRSRRSGATATVSPGSEQLRPGLNPGFLDRAAGDVEGIQLTLQIAPMPPPRRAP